MINTNLLDTPKKVTTNGQRSAVYVKVAHISVNSYQ